MYICCCDCIVKSYVCFLVSECFKIWKVNNLCILCKIIVVLICNIFLIIVFINMLL